MNIDELTSLELYFTPKQGSLVYQVNGTQKVYFEILNNVKIMKSNNDAI